MLKKLKYLLVHTNLDPKMVAWHEKINSARLERGFDVEVIPLQPFADNNLNFTFPTLDRLWKRGDQRLLSFYERLAEKLITKDVLIHYNGANIHPDFLSQFKLFKVYHCADDPESTEVISKPVAPYYDLHAISNVSELDLYRSWGLKNVFFLPLGSFFLQNELADIDENSILDTGKRDIPTIFFGGKCGAYKRGFHNRIRNKSYRKERMELITSHFDNAFLAGSGWPRGFIDYEEMWSIYRRARIGWNVHNSTGPINFRTYDLPSFGVMQICDNKDGLSHIFKIGEEAVGFETVEECIELTKFYLNHPAEASEIALAGWRRWKKEYHPDKVWDTLMEMVAKCYKPATTSPNVYELCTALRERSHRKRYSRRIAEIIEGPLLSLKKSIKSYISGS